MEEIIKRLAEKYKLKPIVIETIIRSQFKTVVKVMKEGDLKNIRIEGLGIFAVKPHRIKGYRKNNKDE